MKPDFVADFNVRLSILLQYSAAVGENRRRGSSLRAVRFLISPISARKQF